MFLFIFLSQDTFFYSLVYDPTQKTLLADKGEIRVGPRFQADVPEMLQEGTLHSLLLIQQQFNQISKDRINILHKRLE